nr:MAG TPA: hypothetical protein [Caudoviricetes sp.]
MLYLNSQSSLYISTCFFYLTLTSVVFESTRR